MKKLNNLSGILSIVLILLVTVNLFVLSHIKTNLVVSEPPEWVAGMVAIIIIAIGLIVLFSLLSLIIQFRHFKQANLLNSGTFVAGFFSLFILAVGVIMLQDIGQEWKAGFDSAGEWKFVFASQGLQGVFGLFMLAKVRQSAKQLTVGGEIPAIEKDEAVFLTVHQVGIFSGILGFVCMLVLKLINIPDGFLEGLFVISAIVALFPYVLSTLYWLMTKRKVKVTEWYDEKQFMDISKGALITLVVSVLLTTIMFMLMVFGFVSDHMLLWFPVYLCGTLLVFSLSNHLIANG